MHLEDRYVSAERRVSAAPVFRLTRRMANELFNNADIALYALK